MACEIFCAACAGVIGRTIAFPLDTIKVVSSVSEAQTDRGFTSAARTIMKSDGIRGFYRGLGISVAASAPGVALYIETYEKTRDFMKTSTTAPSWFVHLGAGLAAEAVSCVVWVPQDVVKERLQSMHSTVEGRYANSWHGFTTLLRLEGVRGMYKGYFSTLGSFGPFSAVYFAAFEEAQHLTKNLLPDNNNGTGSTVSPAIKTALAAAMGNVVACVATNPLEVSKTRYQVHRAVLETSQGVATSSQYQRVTLTSMWDALKWSVRNEGLLALWGRGLSARIMFQTPSSAITFGCVDMLKRRFCESK